MHTAFDRWYGKGLTRHGLVVEQFNEAANTAIGAAVKRGVPDYQLEKATELAALGSAMAAEYDVHYGSDEEVRVITAEVPLEFAISDYRGAVIAKHLLKPDLVYLDPHDDAWLMEHKTAGQIITEHLTIDDQARPYGAMAERALRRKGLLKKGNRFRGVMYNFLRKAFPDDRLRDDHGRSLNKNGTVSKRQPAPLFKRHPATMTRQAKVVALQRIQAETVMLTELTLMIRTKRIDPSVIPKTPDRLCPRFCEYFSICSAEDQGTDIRGMTQAMFRVQNPYDDYNETTEDLGGF